MFGLKPPTEETVQVL